MINPFYDLLPVDLQNYIIHSASADLIRHYFLKRISYKSALIKTIIKLKYNTSYPLIVPEFNTHSIFVNNLFLRTAVILSGTEDYNFWSNNIIYFAYSIQRLTHISNIYFSTSVFACLKLAQKFNIYNSVQSIIFNYT